MQDIDFLNEYRDRLIKYINSIDVNTILKVSKFLLDRIKEGKKIFIVGNGGSLATAIHFAEDLMLNNNLKSRVFHLSNQSSVTAIANDFQYEDIFLKQLENAMDDGDVLITISCSGLSNNLIKAIEYANTIGYTVSISGFHGGYTKRHSDYNIHVRTEVGDYEATEDLQLMICHMIVSLIKYLSGK